jgi:hypothetical protein
MGRMSTALLDLAKSFLARPAKPQNQTLHWVKADKPLSEMSPTERKQFSSHLADEVLNQSGIFQSNINQGEKTMPERSSISLTNWLLIILIGVLIAINFTKAPIIGSHARALTFIEKACNSKNVSVRITYSGKASELNPRWDAFATAIATQAALTESNNAVKAYYSQENPTYVEATSAYNIAYLKVAQVCSNHMEKIKN